MKIAFFDIQPSEQNVFKRISARHSCVFSKQSLTKDGASAISDTHILYIRSIADLTKEILVELPNLQCITTRSTGVDHIDLTYCKDHGIVVSNVPTYATNAVAEHAVALMLMLSRKMMLSIDQVKKKAVDERKLRGHELTGKTLGVIGLGNIGSRVVEIAQGFGMNVLVTTKHPSASRAKRHRVQFVALPTLLQKSDIVSLHVPLTDETYHMINKNTIVSMKKSSILINTARGAVVDTRALMYALDHKVLGGAGLDVLEDESIFRRSDNKGSLSPQASQIDLLERKNVVVTPHNAYNSEEAYQTILKISTENIAAFLRGRPINRVV